MRRDRSCTLNVSSLSRNVKESHLREVFGLYGVIRSCEIALDKKAGIPKGYAYVEFDSQREAENAVRYLHGRGRSRSKPRQAHPEKSTESGVAAVIAEARGGEELDAIVAPPV
ncbi:RNA recognition motif domain-containing protein [Cyclospora cayetanensis]|uniref:RNA recognition motif domain-containing protein n=1 Tax=Cyclospora cayetanensis TaxID=88456 RepID=A0A1D3D9H6_9EIME|nr:RNA recognition motif domain-containing protein [Cyclospora cayetanensis]